MPQRKVMVWVPGVEKVFVTVQVRTPSLELVTSAGPFDLNLEKQASLDRLLAALTPEG